MTELIYKNTFFPSHRQTSWILFNVDIYFHPTRISPISHRSFPPDHLFFEHESHESNEICRRPTDQREVIFSIRTIGLFHPHGKSVSICEYLWETKIIIRVPKIFDSCSKKIRVQKKQSPQVPHTNAEPRRTTFILSGMPGDYHSRLPTRPLPLLLYITSQPSCHSQYTYHEASC